MKQPGYGSAEQPLHQAEQSSATQSLSEGTPLTAVKAGASESSRTLTLGVAFLHILKGNIGPGILALPFHFAQVGPYVGLGIVGLVIVQGVYGNALLLEVQRLVGQRRGGVTHARPLAFEDLGFEVFGSFGRRGIQFSIMALQLGICAVFIAMISSNLRAFWPGMARSSAVMVVGLVCAVLGQLPNLKALTPLSLFGTISMLFVIGGVVWASVLRIEIAGTVSIGMPGVSIHSLVACLSAGFFAFEGITLVLPVGNAVKTEELSGYPRTLSLAMATIAVLFLLVGFLAGTAFPEINTASITAFLAHESLMESAWVNHMFTGMSVLVSLSVLATFPLQLTPAMLVSEAGLGLTTPAAKSAIRLGAVSFCVMLVLALPKLDLLMGLIGCVSSTILAAMPYLLHGKLLTTAGEDGEQQDSSTDTCRRVGAFLLDFFMVSLCAVVMVMGLYDSAVQVQLRWGLVEPDVPEPAF